MRRCQLFCHNQGIYFYEYMREAKHQLFRDGGPCPLETSPLICSENKWIGFRIIGTSAMKESRRLFIHHTPSVCSYMLQRIIRSLFLFFLSGFYFMNIHDS